MTKTVIFISERCYVYLMLRLSLSLSGRNT